MEVKVIQKDKDGAFHHPPPKWSGLGLATLFLLNWVFDDCIILPCMIVSFWFYKEPDWEEDYL